MTVSLTSMTLQETAVRRGSYLHYTYRGVLEKMSYGSIYLGEVYSVINGVEDYDIAITSGPNFTLEWSSMIDESTPLGSSISVAGKLKCNNKTSTKTATPSTITVYPKSPSVSQLSLTRCNASGSPQYDGTYCVVGAALVYYGDNGQMFAAAPKAFVDDIEQNVSTWYGTYDATAGLSDPINFATVTQNNITAYAVLPLNDINTHSIRITSYDTYGSGYSSQRAIPQGGMPLPIDIKEGGSGIGIGCNALKNALVIAYPLVIMSPNGTYYEITVSNSGTLSAVQFIS